MSQAFVAAAQLGSIALGPALLTHPPMILAIVSVCSSPSGTSRMLVWVSKKLVGMPVLPGFPPEDL
jgi:hypothetical protein